MTDRSFIFLLLLAAFTKTECYRSCEETKFCSDLRNRTPLAQYSCAEGAIEFKRSGLSFLMTSSIDQRNVLFNVTILQQDTVHISAVEVDKERYEYQYILKEEHDYGNVAVWMLDRQVRMTFGSGDSRQLLIKQNDMSVDFFFNDERIMTFNNHSRFTMENSEESQAYAFDVFFPGAIEAYGIPERANNLALENTTSAGDPYRLYNVDASGYEVDSRQGLYGAVPVLYVHGTSHTSGLFLANAAEQWVDITKYPDGISTYFMVESGSLNLYVLFGPKPEDVAVQYVALTGTAPVPPLWSLGYHQSRLSYLDQEDVKDVVAEFDNHGIPIDAIWGGAWTQDENRYFTWNPETFNDPIEMLNNLSSTHRKFVTHVDPHLKVDNDYFAYAEAAENEYFAKNVDGSSFVGNTKPGPSSWIDFFREEVSEWYASLFSYDKYTGTTSTLAGIWNDMNEPSVYNVDDEMTFSRDVVFGNGDIFNKDVHNMYSLAQVRATYEGLMNRDDREIRPFVLSRSFFAGSQRYAAVWTGANAADWKHLQTSFPMCLSISLAGISFCGADVGGYIGDPDVELLTRWYQSGAWLPFFRAHATNDTERREPYLFDEEVTGRIRSAIQKRYQHLPLFYTLFYEHFRYGYPVLRPMFYVYPEDEEVTTIDDQFFIGNGVLVKPITQSDVTAVRVYFPGGSGQFWYDIDTPLLYRGLTWQSVATNLNYIPVYYAGGSIVLMKSTNRKNSYETRNDAYNVYIFLNEDATANGTLYEDDYETFAYARRIYQYFRFSFNVDSVSVNVIDEDLSPIPDFGINSYLIYRPPSTLMKNSDSPIPVEPIVITKTADGRNVKDIRFDAKQENTIKLL